MKPFIWLSACLAAGSLAGGLVQAQPAFTEQAQVAAPGKSAPEHASLRAAFDAAWQRALAAQESGGQRRRAEAERAVAGSFWAAPPSLDISHRDDRLQGNAGRRETELGVSVPLWLPGQRAARVDTADAMLAQALAAEHLARLRLAGELRELAWEVAALQAEAAAADSQADALKRLQEDVERRVLAGDLARADALAAQAEQLAASALQADVRQRLQAAGSRWSLLTGLTGLPVPTLQAAVPGSDRVAATGSAEAMPADMQHPELQLARQTTELARKRMALLRQSRRDAPELSVGLRHDVPGRAESAQGSLVVGLRLPFGTDDRNRPLVAAARAELDLAMAQEQRLRERLESETATARAALLSAQAQLAAQTARARLVRERASLIDKSFRAGDTPLPDLLRALASAAQADSSVASQTAALGLAQARLQQTLGLLP